VTSRSRSSPGSPRRAGWGPAQTCPDLGRLAYRDETRFDELALFVLVRRDDTWWLAAGLHTPDRREETYG
jgi:hypothetical protein